MCLPDLKEQILFSGHMATFPATICNMFLVNELNQVTSVLIKIFGVCLLCLFGTQAKSIWYSN